MSKKKTNKRKLGCKDCLNQKGCPGKGEICNDFVKKNS